MIHPESAAYQKFVEKTEIRKKKLTEQYPFLNY